MLSGFNCPDNTMILIDGQRARTVCASPRPSMLPGIWMSVHISAMSDLDSRIATASSASRASIWRVAGVFHHVDRAHAEHHLVLDDENDGWNA
jgi:hypothetical protein